MTLPKRRHSVEDVSSESLDEPELGVLLGDSLELSESASTGLPLGDTSSGSSKNDVEVHSENTSGGVVLNSEINMLVDSKSEVTYI